LSSNASAEETTDKRKFVSECLGLDIGKIKNYLDKKRKNVPRKKEKNVDLLLPKSYKDLWNGKLTHITIPSRFPYSNLD
jgi:hypothetical protein